MRILPTTDSILTTYSKINLGKITISTQCLIEVFGEPLYSNDDIVMWCITTENNDIISSFELLLRFDGIFKSGDLVKNKTITYEVSTDKKSTKIETLRDFIIKSILKIVENNSALDLVL